jgi:tRNA(Ile)-lysidine synthase
MNDGDVVAVATSGGRDSLALLHAAVRCASTLGLRVVALHVHHGLQVDADEWLEVVRGLCRRWADDGYPVTFAWARLSGRPARGESVEGWARRERYAELARLARKAGATIVLLAHHRRDQAETVLLQALRGAGAAGLAAMPKVIVRQGLTWARPWLDIASDDIDDYARRHELAFVRDPSNEDPRWARSRLRTRVMPALREAFPEAESALAAVAQRAQEAREVLDEVALQDLAGFTEGAELILAAWRQSSEARRRNALRCWLALHAPAGAPESLLARLADELADDTPRRWPLDAERVLRSWRGRVAVVAVVAGADSPADAGGAHPLDPPPVLPESDLRLLRCGLHDVPGWPGRLEVFAVPEGGISPTRLAQVHARARAGGEQFRRAPRASDRALKKQFQAAGVPPEAREGPLVFDAQGVLLFVPGLGVDARAWAPAGTPQWAMRWVPFASQQASMDDRRTAPSGNARSTG